MLKITNGIKINILGKWSTEEWKTWHEPEREALRGFEILDDNWDDL